MPEGMLIEKWPKFLDLQAKLPEPGETAALVEMRKMCLGAAATLEYFEEACRETAGGERGLLARPLLP